jgi:hypothetical protein
MRPRLRGVAAPTRVRRQVQNQVSNSCGTPVLDRTSRTDVRRNAWSNGLLDPGRTRRAGLWSRKLQVRVLPPEPSRRTLGRLDRARPTARPRCGVAGRVPGRMDRRRPTRPSHLTPGRSPRSPRRPPRHPRRVREHVARLTGLGRDPRVGVGWGPVVDRYAALVPGSTLRRATCHAVGGRSVGWLPHDAWRCVAEVLV